MSRPAPSAVLLLLAALTVLAPAARAAAPKPTEREAMYQRYLEFPSLLKGGSLTPHWMADGSSFWYEEGAGSGKSFYKVDPDTNTKSPLLDTARLREALRAIEPDRAWPVELVVEQLSLISGDTVAKLTVDSQEYLVRLDTYAVSQAPPVPQNPHAVPRAFQSQLRWQYGREELSPDGRWLAGISDHNSYLRSTEDGRIHQLTTDGADWHEYLVQRTPPNEMWSPDQSKLAVKKLDYRQVPEDRRPAPHPLRPTLPALIEYQRRTELFIFDVAGKQRWRVEPGREPGEEIRILGWRRDGSELLYLVMNRANKQLDLRAANATSGAARVILSERQDTFVMGGWWGSNPCSRTWAAESGSSGAPSETAGVICICIGGMARPSDVSPLVGFPSTGLSPWTSGRAGSTSPPRGTGGGPTTSTSTG